MLLVLLFLVIPSCLEVLRTSVNANPITSAIFAKAVEQDTLDNLMSLVRKKTKNRVNENDLLLFKTIKSF